MSVEALRRWSPKKTADKYSSRLEWQKDCRFALLMSKRIRCLYEYSSVVEYSDEWINWSDLLCPPNQDMNVSQDVMSFSEAMAVLISGPNNQSLHRIDSAITSLQRIINDNCDDDQEFGQLFDVRLIDQLMAIGSNRSPVLQAKVFKLYEEFLLSEFQMQPIFAVNLLSSTMISAIICCSKSGTNDSMSASLNLFLVIIDTIRYIEDESHCLKQQLKGHTSSLMEALSQRVNAMKLNTSRVESQELKRDNRRLFTREITADVRQLMVTISSFVHQLVCKVCESAADVQPIYAQLSPLLAKLYGYDHQIDGNVLQIISGLVSKAEMTMIFELIRCFKEQLFAALKSSNKSIVCQSLWVFKVILDGLDTNSIAICLTIFGDQLIHELTAKLVDNCELDVMEEVLSIMAMICDLLKLFDNCGDCRDQMVCHLIGFSMQSQTYGSLAIRAVNTVLSNYTNTQLNALSGKVDLRSILSQIVPQFDCLSK
ncbi:unnamed protein product [Medioppia subpectinata]|uniref:Uncharacterized protein n=1 Tax=Medioppia subpectinata TaxID=1979941 RepID=A0A7R9KU49_9ACAR|nr:unnamed protein product [Medioppia subpectinata]CAG2109881.1 unnamed protein product [Medioppia subpectinata]